MRSGALDALLVVLPGWVRIFLWIGIPGLGFCFGLFSIWLAHRLYRPRITDQHWTERARLHFAGIRLIRAVALGHAVLTLAFTDLILGGWILNGGNPGLLAPPRPLAVAAVAAVGLWLVGLWFQWRRSRWVWPDLTFGAYVQTVAFRWVVFLPILVVTGLMAVFGPSTWGWWAITLYLVGSVFILWLASGGSIRLGRTLGLIVPADLRLERIVEEAARRTGHRPEAIWIGRTRMVNAMASGITNELVFTTQAMRTLTDVELLAIALHEIGHLRETNHGVLQRLPAVLVFLTLGLWRPIVASFGIIWFFGLVALGIGAALLSIRRIRRFETAADQHAQEHEDADDEPGVYARSLERLHEVGLSPAVLGGRNHTHPHLYDRMVAAGVTPDYPRPAPPPGHRGLAILLFVIAWACYSGEVVLAIYYQVRADRSPAHALVAVALSGGQVDAIGALGTGWEHSDPQRAALALRVAYTHSNWPGYPLRLARILAPTEPAAARSALQDAEDRLGEMFDADEPRAGDLRAMVDDTRRALHLPPRQW